MPRFANSNRPAPARLAALPALLLVAASLGACGDDLNSPDVQSCDLALPVPVTEPATVEYGVDAENAAVASVTFTTPVGDSTITSFPDQTGSTFTFDRTFVFEAATTATIEATGQAGTGGEIVISYRVTPTDDANPSVGNLQACQG